MKVRESAKKWQTAPVDNAQAQIIAARLALPLPFAKVLVLRGLTEPVKTDRFLRPRLSDISDPFRMPGMAAATARIWRALDAGERISIFGDYDADGITSTALMVKVLRELGGEVSTCLPNRMTEGYGLTVAGIERCIRTHSPRLIVTVDCGTNSVDALRIASEQGIDVVVTDHHDIKQTGARPAALVNPHLSEDAEIQGLAGVGVAFKVCHALLKVGRDRGNELAGKVDLRQFLDLVAIGTVADVVPLLGENRVLAWHGIIRLRDTANTGLASLLDVVKLTRDSIDAYHLGYIIGPRFNAAGRLGSPESALELLLTSDDARASAIAQELEEVNRRRLAVERETTDRAMAEAGRLFDAVKDLCLVVGLDDLHIGVIGLTASRLCGAYTRPALVVSFGKDGIGKGSGRSIPAFDLIAGLKECAESLEDFGGHCAAAGFSVRKDRFEAFRSRFHEVCRKNIEPKDLRSIQRIDAWLDLREADRILMHALEKMKPFGEGNLAPVWGVRGLSLVGEPRIIKNSHLKMTLACGGAQIEAIAFGMADRTIPDGPLDVAFNLVRNTYGGRETPQMEIRDFRAAGAAEVDE